MNVLYSFKKEATFLAASTNGDPEELQGSPAVTSSSATSPALSSFPSLFVLHARFLPLPAPLSKDGARPDHAATSTGDSAASDISLLQERLERLTTLQRGLLSLAHAIWRPKDANKDVVVDLESLWTRTAPLPPTAVLSAALATPPLFRVVTTDPPQSGLDDQPLTERQRLHYFLYEFLDAAHVLSSGVRTAAGDSGTRGVTVYSTWDSYLMSLHTALFDSSGAAGGSAPSRLSLAQYIARCPSFAAGEGTAAMRTPPRPTSDGGPRETFSVSLWTEELLWRLLSAMVSVLAVYHNAGFHFGGDIQLEDILCFAIPAKLAGQLAETRRSLAVAPGATGGATVAAAAARFMRTASGSVVEPQLCIDNNTPSHRAFFVLNKLPRTLVPTVVGEAAEDSPMSWERHQSRDVQCVGRLLLSVVQARAQARRGLPGNSPSETLGDDVSAEFLFLLRRMSGGDVNGHGGADTSAGATPSALQLCQLQAMRLHVHAWVYHLVAEDQLHRVHITVETQGTVHTHFDRRWTEVSMDNRAPSLRSPDGQEEKAVEERLRQREATLAEREAKLNTLLSLYELTHERLDALPTVGEGGYTRLREQFLQATAVPAQQEGHAATGLSGKAEVPAHEVADAQATAPVPALPQRAASSSQRPATLASDAAQASATNADLSIAQRPLSLDVSAEAPILPTPQLASTQYQTAMQPGAALSESSLPAPPRPLSPPPLPQPRWFSEDEEPSSSLGYSRYRAFPGPSTVKVAGKSPGTGRTATATSNAIAAPSAGGSKGSPTRAARLSRGAASLSPRGAGRGGSADDDWFASQSAALEQMRAALAQSAATAVGDKEWGEGGGDASLSPGVRARSRSGSRVTSPQKPLEAADGEGTRPDMVASVPTSAATPGTMPSGHTGASPNALRGQQPNGASPRGGMKTMTSPTSRETAHTVPATAAYVPFFSSFDDLHGRRSPGAVSARASSSLPTPWAAPMKTPAHASSSPRASARAAASAMTTSGATAYGHHPEAASTPVKVSPHALRDPVHRSGQATSRVSPRGSGTVKEPAGTSPRSIPPPAFSGSSAAFTTPHFQRTHAPVHALTSPRHGTTGGSNATAAATTTLLGEKRRSLDVGSAGSTPTTALDLLKRLRGSTSLAS